MLITTAFQVDKFLLIQIKNLTILIFFLKLLQQVSNHMIFVAIMVMIYSQLMDLSQALVIPPLVQYKMSVQEK